jgi:hypothetical protein
VVVFNHLIFRHFWLAERPSALSLLEQTIREWGLESTSGRLSQILHRICSQF